MSTHPPLPLHTGESNTDDTLQDPRPFAASTPSIAGTGAILVAFFLALVAFAYPVTAATFATGLVLGALSVRFRSRA